MNGGNTVQTSRALTGPYPGLRPFTTDEAEIFFGREEHVDDLLDRLGRRRFLGVVGPSGCGKSSLIRAGVIPALNAGMLVTSESGWQVAVLRPGTHPMRNLAEALQKLTTAGGPLAEDDGFLHAVLNRSPAGLANALAEYRFASGNNLLVLVDQFEELFRVNRGDDGSEAQAFVSLLLESARTEQFPIYVAITMRSDFLGQCPIFRGLPEALNDSQYLTPRLNREQQRLAIEAPAQLFKADIHPQVVNRVLNEMGTDPDQLPLMQHLMMRMWLTEQRKVLGHTKITLDNYRPVQITLDTYSEVGGFSGCVSKHADRIYGNLTPAEQQVAERVLRRLTDVTAGARMTRRQRSYADLCQQVGPAEEAALQKVINEFRQEGRSFLMPPPNESLDENAFVDISHESIIRQWKRLEEWARDESRIARVQKMVVEKAARWKENGEKAGFLLYGVELAEARDWLAKSQSNSGTSRGEIDLDVEELIDQSVKQEQAAILRDEQSKNAEVQERLNHKLTIKTNQLSVQRKVLIVCTILLFSF